MNLFRSDEHVERWLAGRTPGTPQASGLSGRASPALPATLPAMGATVPVATLSDLAHAWWSDRLSPSWQPHTREQNQAILDRVGLTGEFWRLP
jgi:hypothetical protein